MNARIVAQIVVAVAVSSIVAGCAVQTGDEQTGTESSEIAANPPPPPQVTMTCAAPQALQTSGNHFEEALSALGCSPKYPYATTTTGEAMFESRCPSTTWTNAFCPNEGGELVYVNASTLVSTCWAGQPGQLNASVTYGSKGTCTQLYGVGNYFFADFDPTCTGSGCNGVVKISR